MENTPTHPLVSVIMLSYNHEKYVIDSLESIFNQDYSNFEVITAPEDFEAVKAAIDSVAIPYMVAEVTMLPQSTTFLKGKEAEQMVRLMEALEDCDDVQKVYTNADIPDEVVNSI